MTIIPKKAKTHETCKFLWVICLFRILDLDLNWSMNLFPLSDTSWQKTFHFCSKPWKVAMSLHPFRGEPGYFFPQKKEETQRSPPDVALPYFTVSPNAWILELARGGDNHCLIILWTYKSWLPPFRTRHGRPDPQNALLPQDNWEKLGFSEMELLSLFSRHALWASYLAFL